MTAEGIQRKWSNCEKCRLPKPSESEAELKHARDMEDQWAQVAAYEEASLIHDAAHQPAANYTGVPTLERVAEPDVPQKPTALELENKLTPSDDAVDASLKAAAEAADIEELAIEKYYSDKLVMAEWLGDRQ